MTQTKTCETCKYWENQDSFYDNDVGRCYAVYQYWNATKWADGGRGRKLLPKHAKHLAFVRDTSDFYAMLLTRPNFGCVQHEPK